MPVKRWTCFNILEVILLQKSDEALSETYGNIDWIVFLILRVHHLHLDFVRVEFGSYLDAVVQFFPMGADKYYALDMVCERILNKLSMKL